MSGPPRTLDLKTGAEAPTASPGRGAMLARAASGEELYRRGLQFVLFKTGDSRELSTHAMGAASTRAEAALSPDGKLVALRQLDNPNDDTVRLRLVTSGDGARAPRTLAGGKVAAAAFAPDGSLLVTADDDGRVSAYDLQQPTPKTGQPCGCGRVVALFVAPDKRVLLVGDLAAVWLDATGAEASRVDIASLGGVEWAFADRAVNILLLEAGPDLHVMTLATGEIRTIKGGPFDFRFIPQHPAVWLSGDGSRIAFVRANKLMLLRPSDGALSELPLEQSALQGAIDSRGKALALALNGDVLRVIDLETGKDRYRANGVTNISRLAFGGPNDEQLLIHTFQNAIVASAHSERVLGVLKGAFATPFLGEMVVPLGSTRYFGMDSSVELTSGKGSAMIWDARSLIPIQRLELDRSKRVIELIPGPGKGLRMALSGDGSRFLTYGDGAPASLIQTRDRSPQAIIDEACRRMVRPLTPVERAAFFLSDDSPPSQAERLLGLLPAFLAEQLGRRPRTSLCAEPK